MPIKSLWPVLDLPEIDTYSLIFDRPDLPFPTTKKIFTSTTDERSYDYATLSKSVLRFGHALQAPPYSIRKGDIVATISINDADYPVAMFGILWTGAIVQPINPAYTVSELSYHFRDSGAKLVVCHPTALETTRSACQEVGIPDSHILVLGERSLSQQKYAHILDLQPPPSFTARKPSISPKSDLAFLVYSSGTTGRPKGVMLTHHNVTSQLRQICARECGNLSWDGSRTVPRIPDAPRPSPSGDSNDGGDRILACLPFFHIYGMSSHIMIALYLGVTAFVMSKFSIEDFCANIQRHRITILYVVPPMVLLLAKHECVSSYDFSSVRMANSGAAPMKMELQMAVFKRTGIRAKQGYGLSETSPTTMEQRFSEWDRKVGQVGKLQPNMEAKFCEIREDGVEGYGNAKELPIGETGELYMRGPNVFVGYWRNEAATKECLNEDGWFRTGDIGHVDEEGDFFITDRAKELIKYKGFQVAPAELEGYLIDNEIVDDVVVVGVDSEILETEVPRAYVVRKGGMASVKEGDDKKIIAWLDAKVTHFKRLRGGLKFVESVPKSPSGKLLRRLIRDEAKKEFKELEQKSMKAKL